MPKVSVIIPSYNHEKYIKECIDSILNQTFQDFEIIITDDGSSDGTVDEIRKIKDKRIKLFCFNKNKGASAAVNNCIINSVGEYIAIINSDDVYASDKLEKQVDFLEKNENIGAVLSYISAINERGEDILDDKLFNFRHFDKENRSRHEWLQLFFSGENGLAQPSTLIRRSCYSEVKMYDERFAQVPDWDFWIRFCMKYDLHIIPERLVKYRIRDGNKNISADKPEKRVRINWEMSQMLRNFLNIIDEGEFKKIFPDYNSKSMKSEFIPYYIAKEALKSSNDSFRHFAIDVLYEIFKNKELASRIESEINFSFSDLIKLSGENDLFSINERILINDVIELKNKSIGEKDLLIQKKDDALFDLYHSRIIKPAIIFRDKLRVYNYHLKRVRAHVELRLIRLAKKYLSKNIRLWISQFLPKKYRVVLKKAKNQKWDGPLISIVTPYYNHGKTINETVESVLSQTFKNFEYIIVNDGSSDKNSNDVFAKIDNPKISKIVQDNMGVARARNNGIESARGKYILCLDSDDKIDPTYLEKALIVLESNPGIDIVYSDMYFFGLEEGVYAEPEFDPKVLYKSNIITTAAVFRRKSWERVGGYKSEIGFEDWEFWINLVENGAVAKRIPEALFFYRRASMSRYIEDKKKQDLNVSKIQKMHKNYYKKIRGLINFRYSFENESQFINLTNEGGSNNQNDNKNILLLMPWLTFGGAETLVFNYTNEIKDKFNFSIITGLKSDNAWNYKFREVTNHIIHLPNILNGDDYLNYVCNYIKNYNIDIIHIVHNSFSYFWLSEIRSRFPNIKVISTVFNTLADHFGNSLENSSYIDQFTSDNTLVAREYKKNNVECQVIHNGIDCVNKFNLSKYDRMGKRKELGIKEDEKAVYFIGRLSPEKNPDVFLESAKEIVRKHSKIKFFIIGDGPMRKVLEKSISEFGHKNITYLGYQTDIPQYLSTADIFVLPSKIEGFPLSNIEAMSMGVCVISSDVGGVKDAIIDGENGFLVEPNSSSALADKINFIIDNEHLLEDVSKNSRKTIEEGFSIEILASNYNDLYKNV